MEVNYQLIVFLECGITKLLRCLNKVNLIMIEDPYVGSTEELELLYVLMHIHTNLIIV